MSSEAVQDEVSSIRDDDRRGRVQELIALANLVVEVTQEHLDRAGTLQKLGFGAFDALHIACAEAAGVDILLTTDDRMLRLARRLGKALTVRVDNPVVWLMEEQND